MRADAPVVLTDAEQATPEWLTEALQAGGALEHGDVTGVEVRDNAAFNSVVRHLVLTYSPNAAASGGVLPRQVLLKLKREQAGREEVAFYQLPEVTPERLPMVVPCYGAGYDAATGASYLLLRDVSESHVPPVASGSHLRLEYVPTAENLDRIVDAVADFHAVWWEHSDLGSGQPPFAVSSWYGDEAQWAEFVRKRHAHWEHFIAAEADWFPEDLRRLYETALAGLPGLWESHLGPRIRARRHLTLTNGDCYLGQFLCPRDPASGDATYMVDLDSACADMGAHDLVYLFATFWTPEQRAEGGREAYLLRRYYDRLTAGGVHGYTWDDLMADYRLQVALMIFHPIWDQTYQGSDNRYWWPKMRCLTGAYRDLGCAEAVFGVPG